MSFQDIEKIITKYVTKAASEEELYTLTKWLENPENKKEFRDFIEINYAIAHHMTQFNTDRIKNNLLQKIKKDKRILNRFKINRGLKYAAAAVFFLGLGYFFQHAVFEKPAQELLVPGEDDITLYLEDGGVQIISKNGAAAVHDSKGKKVGEQQADQLKYFSKAAHKKVVYHKLMVPYGKKFELLLSDGTTAYLNSGSSIKYPTGFLEKGKREVFLTGEAYFEVAKDAERPFIIYANDIGIEVLGTKFNVSSYPEDNAIHTVLVEGAVSVFATEEQADKKKSTVLTPGYMATWDRELHSLSSEEVDVDTHVAWMGGKIVFNHLPFKDIVKKLERHYNVSIQNTNKVLDEEVFTASFDKETIEEVLQAFSRNFAIHFNIVNNQIIIY
jgi:hypothetical protein